MGPDRVARAARSGPTRRSRPGWRFSCEGCFFRSHDLVLEDWFSGEKHHREMVSPRPWTIHDHPLPPHNKSFALLIRPSPTQQEFRPSPTQQEFPPHNKSFALLIRPSPTQQEFRPSPTQQEFPPHNKSFAPHNKSFARSTTNISCAFRCDNSKRKIPPRGFSRASQDSPMVPWTKCN